ncbi:MAG: nicotinate-nucleotide adenylyltransferase [Chitinispirillia bacterium]|nr:nicotinate-nucleotide adenylyltransferase [Chitinispirillia bacterium]MCL2242494.1 nicotinate-nucleotide adenylyltransferase [Chitinispirillia bacterium]
MADRRIGILGGVFDPVHFGHLSVAVLARESFGLDEVLFVPSGTPPHKSAVTATPGDRLNMLKIALDGVDGCSVWEGEVRRDGYSYTIDTLNELGGIYGVEKFYFIIGTDNLTEIHKWRSAAEVIGRVTLCVARRPGHEIIRTEALASADIREFPGPQWGASSTMIRDYMKDGHSCKFLLPGAVWNYIKEKGLYGCQRK